MKSKLWTQSKAAISDVCLVSLKSHLFYFNQRDRFIIHRLLVDRRYSLVQSCLVRLRERAFPNRFSYNSILLLKKFMRERLLSFCDERRPTVWNIIQRRSGGNNELLLLFWGKTTSHVFYHSYLCDKELFFLKSYEVYNWVIISFLIFATVSTHYPAFLFALSHSCAYACVCQWSSRVPWERPPLRSPHQGRRSVRPPPRSADVFPSSRASRRSSHLGRTSKTIANHKEKKKQEMKSIWKLSPRWPSRTSVLKVSLDSSACYE